MRDGAIALIRYRTKADEEASSIWKGKNASTEKVSIRRSDFSGRGAYPLNRHQPVFVKFGG